MSDFDILNPHIKCKKRDENNEIWITVLIILIYYIYWIIETN